MKTVMLKKNETLPMFLPHGWKTEVARHLGIHPNTVKNAIRSKTGPNYKRIIKVATDLYGN